MCPPCYQLQLQERKGRTQGAEQKSQFYLAAEPVAYQSLTKLPTCRQPGSRAPGVPGAPGDKCVHLGNSTFYQDSTDPGSRNQATSLCLNGEEDGQRSRTDQPDSGLRTVPLEGQPCRTSGCAFFGSPDTNQFCSKCFSQHTARLPQASRV